MADITMLLNTTLTSGTYTGDYAWSSSDNWPGDTLPTASDNVFLPNATSSTAYQAVSDIASMEIDDLAVGSFCRFFVAENSSLTVGSVTQINGTIQVDPGAELIVSEGGTIASSDFGTYDLFGGTLIAPGGLSGTLGGIFNLTARCSLAATTPVQPSISRRWVA